MALNLTKLVPIYQNSIDALIDQMGKNITLYFEQMVEDLPDEVFDPVTGADRKPSYKSQNQPQVTVNTKVIKALTKHNPENFITLDNKVNKEAGIVRLKTFLTDVPDLIRCSYIVVNSDVEDILPNRYRLIRKPIPIGLKVDRYAVSFWQRI